MTPKEQMTNYFIIGGGLLFALFPFAVYITTHHGIGAGGIMLVWALSCLIAMLLTVRYRMQMYLARLHHELAERKHAEERFSKVFHNSPIPISISTLDTHEVLDINAAALAQIGYAREEYTRLDTVLAPDWMTQPQNIEAARTLREDGSVHHLEMQYRPKSGELRDALVFIEKVDFDGQPCKLMFTLDITELKQARQRLLKTTSELESVVRAFPDLYVRLSPDGMIIDYMSGEIRALGVPPEEFLNEHISDILPEAAANRIQSALDQLDGVGSTASIEYDLSVRRRTRHFEMRMVKESADQIIVIARDITERKRAEIDQQETKTLFSQVIENMREVMLVRDLRERRLVYVSDLFTSLWNTDGQVNPNETGSMLDDVHPDDVGRVNESIQRQKRGEEDDFEFRILHPKTGMIRWMRMRNVPITDTDGAVYRVAVMTEDITERKKSEQAHYEADALFRTLAETMPAAISIINKDGLQYVNAEATRLTGYTFDELREDANLSAVYGMNYNAITGWMQIFLQDDTPEEVPNVQKMTNKRGDTVWLHYAYNIIEQGGEPALLVVGVDVSAMQMAVEVLRQREEEFRALVENSPDFVLRFNREHRITYINPRVERAVNMTLQQARGKPPAILVRNEVDLAQFEQALTQVFESASEQRVSLQSRHPDGNRFFYEARIVPECKEDGTVTSALCISRDVTETRLATEIIQRREEEFRALVENSPDQICRFDRDMRYLYVNPAVEQLSGIAIGQYYGLTMREAGERLYRDGSQQAFLSNLDRWERTFAQVIACGEEAHFEDSYDTDGHGRIYFETRYVPEFDSAGEIVTVLSITRDITEGKRNEEALRESERLFRQFAENINDILVIRDATTKRAIYVSPAFERIWQRPADHLIMDATAYLQDVHPDDLRHIENRTDRQYNEPTEISYRFYRPDGEMRWLRSRTFPIYNDQGEIYRVGGLIEDFTERQQMEERLREHEALLRQITENINEVLYISDFEQKHIIYITESCEAIWGYTSQEIIADKQRIIDAIHPDDRNAAMQGYGERERGNFDELEYRIIARDGTVRWVRSRAFPIYAGDGEVYRVTGIVEDITERKHLEAQALEKERLRTELDKEKEMSQLKEGLAAIVSHEFRTPLTVIMSSSELLSAYFERMSAERRESHLDKIRNQTVYMTELMEDILTFQRLDAANGILNPEPVDLPALCAEIIDNLRSDDDTHDIVFEQDGIFDDLLVDRKLLRHIISNLLGNAQKYSPDGTTIRLVVRESGNALSISVEDQGIGIPADQQQRLFEPFQRARNVGSRRGTGLGLAIVKRCVDIMSGHINLQSQEGEGSTFTVRLPMRVEV